MKAVLVLAYVALAATNLVAAGAVALFGYEPASSTVAVAAFVGASGVFMTWANEAMR